MNVAFINHKENRCGVYQYGKRLASIISKSNKFKISYYEISSLSEYNLLSDVFNIIIYNYHPATMSWLNNNNISKKAISVGIFHEGSRINFDYYIDIDPTFNSTEKCVSIPRPLFNYTISEDKNNNEIPIIGSFGFAFFNKGFDKLIRLVNNQFDRAIIRIHMVNAYYGDYNGQILNELEKICKLQGLKPGIQLIITKQFISDQELLDFLSGNTINIFMYDVESHRGCASVLDYALSVRKPIGISDSNMFRHIYSDQICVYKRYIKDIINDGNEYLEKYRQLWSNQNLIECIEKFLSNLK